MVVVPAYPFQVNNKLLPPKFNTFPGALTLVVKNIGLVPKRTKLFVKFNPIPFPDNDKLFIFLLVGIAASSEATTATVEGVNKFNVKLYNAIRAVGAVAGVTKVPPRAVPEFDAGVVVLPIPTVGEAA